MRLDRFLQLNTEYGRQSIRTFLATGEVEVDGVVVSEPRHTVSRFSDIRLQQLQLQSAQAKYFMLHKPAGVVSATEHNEHPTVLDLLDNEDREGLHLAGRLDLKTTGLVLLTNDGGWSRRVTQPEKKVAKVYRVETQDPIAAETEKVFSEGIYFRYENITTRPAQLQRLGARRSRLTLYEGRYHQVKRMFGYFDNEVIALHRESIGDIVLDAKLKPGEYRALSSAEIALF